MALKIWLDVQAERDLHSIREYLVEHASAVMTERVRKHLRARIDRLRHSPAIGVVTNTIKRGMFFLDLKHRAASAWASFGQVAILLSRFSRRFVMAALYVP
jgi:plasmid stabilization system protein ParE